MPFFCFCAPLALLQTLSNPVHCLTISFICCFNGCLKFSFTLFFLFLFVIILILIPIIIRAAVITIIHFIIITQGKAKNKVIIRVIRFE